MGISFPYIPRIVLKILLKKTKVKYQVHWFPAEEIHRPGTAAASEVQTAALRPVFQTLVVPLSRELQWGSWQPGQRGPQGLSSRPPAEIVARVNTADFVTTAGRRVPSMGTGESGEQPAGGSWGGSITEQTPPAKLSCGVRPAQSTNHSRPHRDHHRGSVRHREWSRHTATHPCLALPTPGSPAPQAACAAAWPGLRGSAWPGRSCGTAPTRPTHRIWHGTHLPYTLHRTPTRPTHRIWHSTHLPYTLHRAPTHPTHHIWHGTHPPYAPPPQPRGRG